MIYYLMAQQNIPKPKYQQLTTVLLNTFYQKYKDKLFPDPTLYATAVGVWTVNKMSYGKVVELSTDYVLMYFKTKYVLDFLFLSTISHFFDTKADGDIYSDISANAIDELIKDLTDMIENNFLLIDRISVRLGNKIAYEMYKQLILWVSGLLYGFYSDEYGKILDYIISNVKSKNAGSIQTFMGVVK